MSSPFPPVPGQPLPQQPVPSQPRPSPPGAAAYGAGPTGELVLHLRRPFGAMGMITPQVSIDGYRATVGWGRNAFPAPAGERRVEAAASYLWTYGRAATTVAVAPGQTSELHYSPPLLTFLRGAVGPTAQRRPGLALLVAVLVVLLLLVVLAVAGALLDAG